MVHAYYMLATYDYKYTMCRIVFQLKQLLHEGPQCHVIRTVHCRLVNPACTVHHMMNCFVEPAVHALNVFYTRY